MRRLSGASARGRLGDLPGDPGQIASDPPSWTVRNAMARGVPGRVGPLKANPRKRKSLENQWEFENLLSPFTREEQAAPPAEKEYRMNIKEEIRKEIVERLGKSEIKSGEVVPLQWFLTLHVKFQGATPTDRAAAIADLVSEGVLALVPGGMCYRLNVNLDRKG